MNTNAQLETLLNWTPKLRLRPGGQQHLPRPAQQIRPERPERDRIGQRQPYRFANDDLDAAVKKLVTTDPAKPEYKTTVGDIQKIIVKNMAYIW